MSPAPLASLTSSKTRFDWSGAAQDVFDRLKGLFTSAPILITPDPEKQFIVEVYAFDVGVGAILLQRSSLDDNVHPCAFYSHRLSSAERNYDVGNRELLAIRLALGEWRHWLKGASVPFIVWTDHQNLEYIRSAKRLNARQARWALFFFVGAFTIVKVLSPVSIKLKFSRQLRCVHPVFHVSWVKPVILPPLPINEEASIYRVRKLLDVRPRGRGHQFLGDWEGYGPEERHWIPARDVLDRSLIEDFYRSRQAPASGAPGALVEGGVLS